VSLAIGIAFTILIATTVLTARLAARGRKVSMSEWAVGGGSFGAVLVWFLSAGEIYTTFAFLGGSGLAYAEGAPAFYILANAPLAYVLGYWLQPRIWALSRVHGVYSQGDYFQLRFGNRWLATLMALVAIIGLVSYTELQLTGLTVILEVLFKGSVSKGVAVALGAALVIIFTFTAGLRSMAFASIVKDVLVLGVLIALIATVAGAVHLGSISGVLHAVDSAHPSYGALPGLLSKKHHGAAWYMTTILLTNIGYWMLPHLFQSTCAAKDIKTIRRNAIFQPLYGLTYFFVFLLGFAAIVAIPAVKDSNAALVTLVATVYPSWFIGLVAAAAMLVAIVPAAVLLLTVGTVFSQNIYLPLVPQARDSQRLLVGRIASVVATLAAAALALHSVSTIVTIILVVYAAIAQIAPGFVLSLLWRRVSAWGVAAGAIIGVVCVTFPPAENLLASISFHGNVGFTAFVVNFIVVVAVSAVTKPPHPSSVSVGVLDTAPVRARTTA
jgi:SSS family solute:Na+ symporter